MLYNIIDHLEDTLNIYIDIHIIHCLHIITQYNCPTFLSSLGAALAAVKPFNDANVLKMVVHHCKTILPEVAQSPL